MVKPKLEKTKHRKHDPFLPTLTKIFTMAQWFGIPSYGNKISHVWAVVALLMLIAIEGTALWKLAKNLSTMDADDESITARVAGSIFYGNGLLSLILSWFFISSWKRISFFWSKAEVTDGAYLSQDRRIHGRVVFITWLVALVACGEHILSMISATGFDIPPLKYFERYILSSHGFIITNESYTLWTAIPIFLLSLIATILWNFQDLIIILISVGLTSRYRRLNLYVNRVVNFERRNKDVEKVEFEKYLRCEQWRRIREAYVRQAALVRMVDAKIGPLILLSNINNFYFICLQLFLGINKSQGSAASVVYYLISLAWLIFRACGVVLTAADIQFHSKRALTYINACPAPGYNIEVR
ncbi:unnamed protein product [Chilo suppressalis]|uniref:ABC transmembrane type-1 domain-containing protein n=1 Tax=Chilo suppressalis TaxID=168631 RepID=A0ABN8L7L2_CHISP|nr:unnamed protein product [Chilo suppressalis]